MFRQTYPLFKYWIYVYNYTCTKIRLFLSIPIHLNTIYKSIYILCQRRATSSTAGGVCPPQGLLDMLAGPGGRRLRERLPPGKVAFPRSCQLPSARHPNGFSLFL